MNKTYKSVYCHATQSWVAVSEATNAKGKTSVKSNILSTVSDIKTGATTFAVASVGALFLLASPVSHALEIGSLFINNAGTPASAGDPGDVAIGGNAKTGADGNASNKYASGDVAVGGDSFASSGINSSGAIKRGVAVGYKASTNGGVAIGDSARTTTADTIAIGAGAYADKKDSIAIGSNARVKDGATPTEGAIAIGANTQGFAYGVALGVEATADQYAYSAGKGGIAIGYKALTKNESFSAIAIGNNATAGDNLTTGSVAIGESASSIHGNTVAIGTSTQASQTNAIAIGNGAQATAKDAISIGTGNVVSGQGSGAIGDPTTVNGAGTYVYGNNNGTIDANNSGVFGNDNTITGVLDSVRVVGNTNNVSANAVSVLGNSSTVTGVNGISIGNKNTVSGAGDQGIAIGYQTQSINGAVAIGENAYAESGMGSGGPYASVAVGFKSVAKGKDASAFGNGAIANANYSTALGNFANATASNAIAAGNSASARGVSSSAFGNFSEATGSNATAIGGGGLPGTFQGAKASADGATAVGGNDVQGAIASGKNATAISGQSQATAENAIAIGLGAQATAKDAISIGTGNIVTGQGSGAIGDPTTVNGAGTYSVGNNNGTIDAKNSGVFGNDNTITGALDGVRVIGNTNKVTANGAMVMGNSATVSATNGVALGSNTSVTQVGGVALGSGSVADTAAGIAGYVPSGANASESSAITSTIATRSAVDVGSCQITSVAAGTANDDAVNVAQLKAAEAHYYSVNDGGTIKTNYNNDGATGFDSMAAGISASATGSESAAVGKLTSATGGQSLAVGTRSVASGYRAAAIGYFATASADWTTAVGQGAVASISDATAVGSGANATGMQSTAFGSLSYATEKDALAAGYYSYASAEGATALGASTYATAVNATSVGNTASAKGENAIAIGYGAQATAKDAISIGTGNIVTGQGSGVIGDPTTVNGTGTYSVGNNNGTIDANNSGVFGNDNTITGVLDGVRVIGNTNTVSANGAMVMGNSATVSATDGVALGSNTSVTQVGGVALGSGSVADTAAGIAGYVPPSATAAQSAAIAATKATNSAVDVGSRQITRVAAGTADDDAVNVSQLKAVTAAAAASGVHYYSVNDQYFGAQDNYNNDGATGRDSLAAGVGASSTAENAVSVGVRSVASGEESIVMGYESEASGERSQAYGFRSIASGYSAIAMGQGAVASGDDGIAIGGISEASGVSSVALGNEAAAGGEGATALGTSAVASGKYAIAMGPWSGAAEENTIAAGLYSEASAAGAIALGAESIANKESSVALGVKSTTATNATKESSATLNGLTYGTFAGQVTDPGMQVSVGSVGAERQIKNVGSGAISATSTDAINGSQLYATNAVLGNAANSVETILGGNATLNPDGSITMTNIGDTGYDTVHEAIKASQEEVAAGTNVASVTPSKGANGQTIYTVNANGTTASAGSTAVTVVAGTPDANNVTDYVVDLSKATKDSLVNADNALQTVVTQIDGVDVKTISKTDNTANFVTGKNITLTDDGAGGIQVATADNVTFNTVNTTNLYATGETKLGNNFTVNNAGDVTYTGPITSGDNITNKTYVDQTTAAAKTEVVAGTNVSNVGVTTDATDGHTIYTVNAKGTTASAGSTAVTVVAGTPDANNVTDYVVDLSKATKDSLVNADNALQTVVTQIDGVDVKTISKTDNTANFVTGKNITLTDDGAGGIQVATADNVTFNTVNTTNLYATGETKLGNNFTVNNAGDVTYTGPITSGDNITNKTYVDQTTAAAKTEVVAGTNVSNVGVTTDATDGHTIYTVNAKGTTASAGSTAVTVVAGTPDANNVTDYVVDLSKATKDSLVNADNALQTVVTQIDGVDVKTISKTDNTANFVTGKNITLTDDGAGGIQVATADNVTFNTVNTTNLYATGETKLGNNFTVNNAGDVTYTGPITSGDNITNKTYVDQTTAAAKTEVVAGTNVSNVGVTTDATDGHTIYTVNAKGTTASAGSTAVTVVAGTPDANNVTDYVVDLSKATKDSLVNADNALQTVVTQIDGVDVKTISKTDNTANFVTGKNITLTDDGAGGIQVATADNVTFNTVNTTNLYATGETKLGNNFTVNNAGDVTYTGPITSGDNITNKTYVDQTTAAAKTEVVAGTNVSNVGVTTDATDGHTIYTVNAKGTTASAGSTAVTVVAGTPDANNVTDYVVDLSKATKDSLVNADNALQTVVTQIDGVDVKTISKTDNTANFVTGKNITLTDDGAGGIQVATADNVTFNTVNTTNLYATGETKLGNNFTVNNAGDVTYTGSITNGDHITNKTYVDQAAAAAKTTVIQGDNIVVTPTNNPDGSITYQVATAKDVTFDSVIVGSVSIDKNNVDAAGNTIITGLGKGEVSATSTDAINGSQLYSLGTGVQNIIGGNTTYDPTTGTYVNNNIGNTGQSTIHDAIASVNDAATKAKTTVTQGDNIVVTQTTNADGSTNYEVATAKDVTFDSVTVGSVSIDSKNVDAAGNTIISGVGAGEVSATSTDAINGSQLYSLGTGVQNIIGGNTTYDPTTGTYVNNNIGGTGENNINDAIASVKDAATKAKTTVTAGSNVVVTPSLNADGSSNYEVAVANDLNVNSVTSNAVTVGSVNIDKTNVDAAGNTIISGVGAGAVSATSTDAINGSQLYATNQQVTQNTTDITNINTTLDKGMNFSADSGTVVNRKLGDTVAITGDGNITTTTTADGVQVGLSNNLNLNNVTVNQSFSVAEGATVNMGGNVIQNVGAGVADTDAVNVGQLKNVANNIGKVEDKLSGGIAASAALAVVTPVEPGTYHLSGGAAYYNGGYGVGFNLLKRSDNGRTTMHAGVGWGSGGGGALVRVGAGFSFGGN